MRANGALLRPPSLHPPLRARHIPDDDLCRKKVRLVLLHWSQYSESSLVPFVVVVMDVVLDHSNEFFTASKSLAVISLTLEYSPEAFHRTVVYALGYPGHALCHAGLLQLGMECSVCILEATVTVAQWSGTGISGYCMIERSEHQWVVVTVTDHI